MDKNTIIGAILAGLIIIGFSLLNKPTPQPQPPVQSTADTALLTSEQETTKTFSITDSTALSEGDTTQTTTATPLYLQKGTEKLISLKNDLVKIELNTLGGIPEEAQLLKYNAQEGKELFLFKKGDLSFNLPLRTVENKILNTAELYFNPLNVTDSTVTMRLNIDEQNYLDFVYTLMPGDYRIKMNIMAKGLDRLLPANMSLQDLEWEQRIRQQEQSWKFENQYTSVMYRYAAGGVERINKSKEKKSVQETLRWIAFKDKYFSTVLISRAPFQDNVISSAEFKEDSGYIKNFSLKSTLQWNIEDGEKASLIWYVGPNDYNLLKAYDKGLNGNDQLDLDHLVYMGGKLLRTINVYMIIPVVTFLSSQIGSWGIIILILTILIKIFLSPFTFKSYLSQAKMRVLKPQVEAISAKYPGKDQDAMMKRQTETMSLYRAAGANPMSGCLPMLLQLPFLIALYMYFPTSIYLRGESFLWAKDLSTYDPIISWNFDIPFITGLLGNHISLFCLLMTIVNIAFNKYLMQQNSAPAQEGMKMMKIMPYFMSVFLFFFFNQNASGLCYYYLLTSLLTMIQNWAFRFAINEEKLLARLEENKKKPRKKSKWQQRLEEAQKQQQAMQRQKNKHR
ncbi:membrane protein insertase YidC [Porphyromonas macacae]|uniref:Membrane protein insertase YidC n=1 Tax=Porphyromonas macacae TaxID=28115 RepID=A0A379DK04_9PORP|nr:membrane protein insertase YidC [Porphyromonas macacae]SUB78492.1 Oxa1Ec [Porphyromonas macacae]